MATDAEKLVDWDALADDLEGAMRPYYAQAIEWAYGDAEELLKTGSLAYQESNPAVKEVIDGLAQKVRDVSDNTREEIQSLIDQADDNGWGVDELAKRIRALAEIAPGEGASAEEVSRAQYRSELIAQTELADAYTQGSLLAYDESGQVDEVECLNGGDPCPICSPLGGTTAKLDEGFGDLGFPPFHPGCTCAIAPVVK